MNKHTTKMIKKIILALALLNGTQVLLNAQSKEDSLAIVKANWQIEKSHPGIVQKSATISNLFGGPQSVHILELDPKQGINAEIAYSDTLILTSKLARDHGAIAAINGSYFAAEGNSVSFFKVHKEAIDSTIPKIYRRCNGLVYTHKGKLQLLPWSKAIEDRWNVNKGIMLASGPSLMENGTYSEWLDPEDLKFFPKKHPRSALAFTKDGTILAIAVDGRAPGNAIGMSIPEFAFLTKILGCERALNLDGGGSTTLWIDGKILNHPTDNKRFDHEGERKVANIIYFYYKK